MKKERPSKIEYLLSALHKANEAINECKVYIETIQDRVECPDCGCTEIIRNGNDYKSKQKYLCRNKSCSRISFIREAHDEFM